MKKYITFKNIATIFGIAFLVLLILWLTGAIAKVLPSLITGFISLISKIIDIFNKSNSQKHKGSGDNVGGDKINSPSHSGNGDIISGDKTEQKHTGTGNNIGTIITNHNYSLPDIENSIVKKYPTISSLTALEIMNKVEKSPLMQQEETANTYYGIRVKWRVRLFMNLSQTENDVYLMTVYEERNIPYVYFHVNTEQYPNIRVAEKGMVYNITGTIIQYKNHGFDINLEKLEELDGYGKYHFA